jgi:hypothetical protein
MARNYSTKDFFRQIPNTLVARTSTRWAYSAVWIFRR